METPEKPPTMFSRPPARKLQLGHQENMCATPTRALISQTESAIQDYLKDGCETNLPLIQKLEDISYQLWIESNTNFLDEATHVPEDDGWQWDEDCFIDSSIMSEPQTSFDHYLQTSVEQSEHEDRNTSSYSSYSSSIRPFDDTGCYMGYLGCSELDETNVSDKSESQTDYYYMEFLEDWVVIPDDYPIQTEEQSPIGKVKLENVNECKSVKKLQPSKPIEIKDSKRKRRIVKACRKRLKHTLEQGIEQSSEMCEPEVSDTGDGAEDWLVLSMRITEEVRKVRADSLNDSLDSGIKSPYAPSFQSGTPSLPSGTPSIPSGSPSLASKSPSFPPDASSSSSPENTGYCNHNKHCHHCHEQQERPFCFKTALTSMVQYLTDFRRSPVKGDKKTVCCENCQMDMKDVIMLMYQLLKELYRYVF